MTPKQELFCIEYLKDKNATAAYMRAGYAATGHAAEANASRLLSNAEIKAFISNRLTEVKDDLVVEVKQVLREMLRVGTSDIRKLFNEDGSMKSPHEWPDDVAASVAGVEVYEEFGESEPDEELEPQGHGGALKRQRGKREVIGMTKKVKMWDKNKGLEMLGKHLKMFTDILEIKDVTPLADRMKQARERAKTK